CRSRDTQAGTAPRAETPKPDANPRIRQCRTSFALPREEVGKSSGGGSVREQKNRVNAGFERAAARTSYLASGAASAPRYDVGERWEFGKEYASTVLPDRGREGAWTGGLTPPRSPRQGTRFAAL